jgi:hypothetical protein
MGPRKIQDTGISPSTALNLARVLVSSDMTKKAGPLGGAVYICGWECGYVTSCHRFTALGNELTSAMSGSKKSLILTEEVEGIQ